MENPIKIDDLGVPLFLETPIRIPVIDGGAFCHSPATFESTDELIQYHTIPSLEKIPSE